VWGMGECGPKPLFIRKRGISFDTEEQGPGSQLFKILVSLVFQE